MRRVVVHEKHVRSEATRADLTVDTAGWDTALVSYHASGAAGSALICAPAEFEGQNFAGAPAAPGAGGVVHVGIGPGCGVPVPLPERLRVGLTVTGGRATVAVALRRYEYADDELAASRFASARAVLDEVARQLRNIRDLLAARR